MHKCERDVTFKPFAVGSSYPNISGSDLYHNQGIERPYLRCLIWELLISLFS